MTNPHAIRGCQSGSRRGAFLLFALLCAGVAFGAENSPAPSPTTAGQVGDLGRREALVFEGNNTFTQEQILSDLSWRHLDFHAASHRAAPLSGYEAMLRRQIKLGYQRAGFPDVTIQAAADPNTRRLIVRVNEGSRYRCGQILLTGAKSPTNEVVRRKLIDALTGSTPGPIATGQLDRVRWTPGQPAPFDEFAREELTQIVTDTLAALDYFRPELSLRLMPDPARQVADLSIEIASEGIKGTIGEIEVTGLRTNTRPQVLDYLSLKPGMELHANLVGTTSNQLWRSARFLHQVVTLTPLPPVGRFKLSLDLEELPDGPPLNRQFSPSELALLKFRDWLADWRARAEDFVASVEITNDWLRQHLDVVLSPAGFVLAIREGSSNGPGKLQYAIVASAQRMAFHSVVRQNKFAFRRTSRDAHVMVRILPSSPRTYGQGDIHFGLVAGLEESQPFRLELDLQPVAFLSMAQETNTVLNDGVLTVKTAGEDGYFQVLKVEANTGRLVELFTSFGQTNIVRMQLHSAEGALARLLREIEGATANHPNRYATNHGFASWVAFVTGELLESPLFERILSEVYGESAPNEGPAATAISPGQIKSTLALLRDIFGHGNLDRTLAPLSRFFDGRPQAEGEQFFVPMDGTRARANGDLGVPMIGAWVVNSADAMLPRDTWPWILVRETAFTLGGEGRFTEAELDGLLNSVETGPIGCLTAASLLGRTNPRLARTFAERGLARLSLAAFRQDYRLLLRTNTILGDVSGNAVGLLGGIDEAHVTSLVASLTPDENSFLRQLTRLLREAKGQPAGEAAWPAIEQHWDKVLRRQLEFGLNRFLPQVRFLTNSQALYARGLQAIDKESVFQDFEEAAQCFRKAAEQGHAGAQLNLGQLLEQGQGLREDFAEAMRWYRRAAEQKEPHANCRVAGLYRDGKGVPQDLDEAARWYRVEAEGDCYAAQFNLASLLAGKSQMDEALRLYRRAAEHGSIEAQAKLGDLLSDGLAVPADLVEACQWLTLAAKSGDNFSSIRLRRLKAKLTTRQLEEVERRVRAVTDVLESKKSKK